MITLKVKPNEGSSFIIEAVFSDPDGVLFVPKTLFWTLSDAAGNIINLRERVSDTPQGSTHNFVLSGSDTVYDEGLPPGVRVFTIDGTFDSEYGDNLEFRDQCKFGITNMVINP